MSSGQYCDDCAEHYFNCSCKSKNIKDGAESITGNAVETIEALRTALAQPEQYDQTELNLCKKCGWKAVWPDGCLVCEKQEAQPEKEWVGLTDDELHALHFELKVQTMGGINTLGMYRILEAKLKEKNT